MTATIKVKDLAPATRAWLTSVLHADVTDEDECTLTLQPRVIEPSPEQREAAREKLMAVMDRIGELTKGMPEEEIYALVDEAVDAVHSRNK